MVDTIFGPDLGEASNAPVHLTPQGMEPLETQQVTPTEVAAKMHELAGIIEKIKKNGGTPPAGAETLLLTNPQTLANDPVALSRFSQEVNKTEMEASGELLREEAGQAVGCVLCAAEPTNVAEASLGGFLTAAFGLPARPRQAQNEGFPLPPLPI